MLVSLTCPGVGLAVRSLIDYTPQCLPATTRSPSPKADGQSWLGMILRWRSLSHLIANDGEKVPVLVSRWGSSHSGTDSV